jgi:hypothetical protein
VLAWHCFPFRAAGTNLAALTSGVASLMSIIAASAAHLPRMQANKQDGLRPLTIVRQQTQAIIHSRDGRDQPQKTTEF